MHQVQIVCPCCLHKICMGCHTASLLFNSSYTSTSTLTDKGVFYELTPEFRQQHYLVGLVLSDLSNSFDVRCVILLKIQAVIPCIIEE